MRRPLNRRVTTNIISRYIKEIRESKGLTQEMLAEMVGCSREFINRIENRKEDISLKMLLKLAQVFELNPQEFFD